MQFINLGLLSAILITIFIISIFFFEVYRRYQLNSYWYFITLILGLPLSYLVNEYVKLPLFIETGLRSKQLAGSLTFIDSIIWVIIVGSTEEIIKIIVFLICVFFDKDLNYKNKIGLGWAVGIGFGIGEMLYLGYSLVFDPSYPSDVFLWLQGFCVERFFVTFAHAFFVLVVLKELDVGYATIPFFLLISIFFHALFDYPILAISLGFINWIDLTIIIILELILIFILSFYFLNTLMTKSDKYKEMKHKDELLERAKSINR